MRSTFKLRVLIVPALVIPLLASSAAVSVAAADAARVVAPAAAAPTPEPGERLTSYIRRASFPEVRGCVPGSASRPLSDHRRKLTTTIPCTSQGVIPARVQVPANFHQMSGNALVNMVADLANISHSDAMAAVLQAAGMSYHQLPVIARSSTTSLGRAIVLQNAAVEPVTAGDDTAERTTFCGYGGGAGRCATLSGLSEGLFWGALGATIGSGAAGAIGAILGALIGFIIGIL